MFHAWSKPVLKIDTLEQMDIVRLGHGLLLSTNRGCSSCSDDPQVLYLVDVSQITRFTVWNLHTLLSQSLASEPFTTSYQSAGMCGEDTCSKEVLDISMFSWYPYGFKISQFDEHHGTRFWSKVEVLSLCFNKRFTIWYFSNPVIHHP